MSRPRLSPTNCWISTFCFVECSVSMIASATLTSGARITPMPCVPSSSLMTTGAPPTRSIAGRTSARLRTNAVARHADVVAREDLGRAQLVARVRDAVRGVRRVDVHLLELAHDGGAEVGDRVADARQDRVVVARAGGRGTAGRARARRGRSRSAGCSAPSRRGRAAARPRGVAGWSTPAGRARGSPVSSCEPLRRWWSERALPFKHHRRDGASG